MQPFLSRCGLIPLIGLFTFSETDQYRQGRPLCRRQTQMINISFFPHGLTTSVTQINQYQYFFSLFSGLPRQLVLWPAHSSGPGAECSDQIFTEKGYVNEFIQQTYSI
jgi:hypothetical protein